MPTNSRLNLVVTGGLDKKLHTKNVLTISLPGINIYDQSLMLTAIEQLSEEGKRFCLLENSSDNAHLVVLDDENARGKALLQHTRRGQIKLVLSSNPISGQNLIAVQKPIELNKVIALLAKLYTKMQDQVASRRAQVVGNAVTVPDTVSENNSDGMFNTLLKLKDNQEIACLNLPGFCKLYVDGQHRSLATSATIDELRSHIRSPINDAELKSISHSEFCHYSTGLNMYPLYNIIWIAALASSNSRPLNDHDVNEPIKLRAWPNFTRYDYNPEYFKLAAILAQHAIPLSKIEDKTQIPYPIILRFFNAVYAVDLIVTGLSELPINDSGEKIRHRKMGLFAKIAQKLNIRI